MNGIEAFAATVKSNERLHRLTSPLVLTARTHTR